MEDQAEREQAELKTLLEHEARRRALMDAAFYGIFISEKGIVVEVSDALLELSGYGRGEVIGRPVTDFVALELREAAEQRLATGIEGRVDTIGLTKSGQRRRVEVVSRNLLAGGRTVRLTAVRDVTEVRRLEDQLQQAQQMEALARLASGVVHDFNNVLLIIRGVADRLTEVLDEQRRIDAREIIKAVNNGAALTRWLLSYGRQEPGTPRVLNLNTVVRGTEQMVRQLIGDGIRLIMDLAPDLAMVRADPNQLQQVILNLVINARDAMPRGGTLTIQTRNVDVGTADAAFGVVPRSGRYALLLVTDSGSGLSNEVKARLFEPFFTTKEPGRGTGLGLSIVQQIVDRSGGFIEVTSVPGAGTTFSIHLPHADADS